MFPFVPHPFAPLALFAIRPCESPSLFAACPLPPGSLSPSGLAPSLFLFHATPAWCALDNELFNCCNAKKTDAQALATHLPLPSGSLPRLLLFTFVRPLPAHLLAMSSSSPPSLPPFASSSQLLPVMLQKVVRVSFSNPNLKS